MKEIAMGHINSELRLKEDEEVVIYTGSQAFHGRFKKMMTSNLALRMEVDLKIKDVDRTMELLILTDAISGVGKLISESQIQTVSDSKINEDLKKKTYNNESVKIARAGSAKPGQGVS